MACSSLPTPVYDYKAEPNPTKLEFVLGVGDVVGINVWDNQPLNTTATIRPDGTITMPLVGDLQAVNKTPTQLKEEIKKRIADYVKTSGLDVTVSVQQWHSYRFTVSGEVTSPGLFSQENYVTVAEAIALSGGFTRFAKRNQMKLMRRGADGKIRTIPLVYDLLATGERPDMNIYMISGDSLYVP
ncbi:MAG: polysaccharide biosynthesis/export family protein [Myxococcales bacterium]|nr:polysaccharide biosynthesis/export family protein [Myxococcales bacterium]HRC56903.1 polysaccharide biosynthesis/export family protein [Kofleriaceae bacterium]